MKKIIKENGLYEALKLRVRGQAAKTPGGVVALDDTERVKVLSPGRLVFKRFFRNKLAIVGLVILIFMFSFSFLGAVFYPYSQTELFYKYDTLAINYASATVRTEHTVYAVEGGPEVKSSVFNRFNSYIIELDSEGGSEKTVIGTDGTEYIITRLGDKVYTLSTDNVTLVGEYFESSDVAVYDKLLREFDWSGEILSDEFQTAALAAIDESADSFEHDEVVYSISVAKNKYTFTRQGSVLELQIASPGEGFEAAVYDNLGGEFEFAGKTYRVASSSASSYEIFEVGERSVALIASTYVFNAYETARGFSDDFKTGALFALYGSGSFETDDGAFTIRFDGDTPVISDAAGENIVELSSLAVRRYSGQDTLSIDFKTAVQDVIDEMQASGSTTSDFVFALPALDETANYIYDEDGNVNYVNTEIEVTRKNTGEYVLTCEQVTYLIDIFASPSLVHLFGTDGDGMDILARMMYGGRISLMVGFVVVFIEIFIGIVLGGMSGFFGGWVDTLIMRVADIFYCVPSYPILIIMGALFDKMKMNPYQRLIWMMVTLGILGWASVARLVRGQILSLREQEFMIAQNATGMKANRRIFRHLIPNVMPQLIVTATMGVGSVIIYESTLSFLGLGVKHPLATWGTMINTVTASAEDMIKYTYIWVPVGLLICLTVIAFNFVGDGLRDAFDPKMKQ